MEVKKILNNKVALMGISTLAILFMHFSFENTNILYLQRMFACSVDIFLLVSGIGCYFSIQKHTNIEFFKRRIKRLLPIYLTIIICYGLYTCIRFNQSIWYFIAHNGAFISLFLYGEITGWFLVEIVLCYILTPILNKIIQKQWYYGVWIILGIWVVSAQLEFYTHDAFYMINNFIIIRLPSYILGLLIGYWLQQNPEAKVPIKIAFIGEIFCIILMLINLFMNNINSGFIMKIICTPYGFFTALLLVQILDKKSTPVLWFFGTISLEAYLIYEKVLAIFNWDIGLIYNQMVTNIIAVIITTILAVILKSIFNFILGGNKCTKQ